jgi:elongation factor Ts
MTGVGMSDAKKALDACDGDFDAAAKWLREQGLVSAAKRADREASQGAVSVVRDGHVASVVELRCETDFVAKSPEFVGLVDEIAAAVASKGLDAVNDFTDQIDTLRTTLKENISVGRLHRLVAGDSEVVDTYLHKQSDRGVNGVAVVLKDGTDDQAHEIAVHIAFARPLFLTRDEVPAAEVEEERATIEQISRNEGKPEAALPKIIEGRLNAWFKDRVLVEQAYVKDEKQTVNQYLGKASVTAFAQVAIGG